MKIFRRLLFIALCVFIICNKSCFCETNCCKTNPTHRTGLSFFACSNKSADEVIGLAKKECDKFNYKESIRLYRQALRLNPSHPDEVYLGIGSCYILLDNYKKAVEPLTKSIEINPENSSAYYNRGFVYYKLKDLKKSKQDLKKANEINNFTNPEERKETKKLSDHIEFLESTE